MNFLRGRYSIAVALGAILGALSRFYITDFFQSLLGKEFGFYGTFFVNVSGCLILAYIFTMVLENIRIISPELGLMITTGFCGSYTTFSAYCLEAKGFLEQGDIPMLLCYWFGSTIVGMIAIKIGILLGRAGFPR
jgi:fluoride exporter